MYLPSLENTLASSRRPHGKTVFETQAFLWKAVLLGIYVEMKNRLKKELVTLQSNRELINSFCTMISEVGRDASAAS